MNEETVICARCGRTNRGIRGVWVDNGRYAAGEWDEPGWLFVTAPTVAPMQRGSFSVYRVPVSSGYVCPGCQLDEERVPDERYATRTCDRCGRENRALLDAFDGMTEWEESDWMERRVDEPEPLDRAHTARASFEYVCRGCQTDEERGLMDAIVWQAGGPE